MSGEEVQVQQIPAKLYMDWTEKKKKKKKKKKTDMMKKATKVGRYLRKIWVM